MKILFFTYDFPYPTNTGGKSRAYNLLKYGKKNDTFVLFSFVRDDFREEYIENIKQIGIRNIHLFKRRKLKNIKNLSAIVSNNSIFNTLYYDKAVHAKLKKLIISEKIDLVHFESFYTSFYLKKDIREIGAKLICGEENIEYKIYEDYVNNVAPWFLRPLYGIESRKIREEEEKIWSEADLCLAVTQPEAEYIEKISNTKCSVIENGIDPDYFIYRPKVQSFGKNILFVGNFTYYPNFDAIKYFYQDIFKNMEDKDVTLTIIGKKSGTLPFAKDKMIKTIEYVEDIREYYYNADIFVSPVRFGGGTNFKLLEAMACGTPVIADRARITSIGAQEGTHLLTAGNANEFSKCIKQFTYDHELRYNITRNAREFVEKKYSWILIGQKLNKIWHDLSLK